jgi:hypothetical protein
MHRSLKAVDLRDLSLGALKPATNGRLSPAVLLHVDFCQNRYVWQSMTAAEEVGLR